MVGVVVGGNTWVCATTGYFVTTVTGSKSACLVLCMWPTGGPCKREAAWLGLTLGAMCGGAKEDSA